MKTSTKLVENNLGLVHHALKNIYIDPQWGADYEDLFQIGCIGLLKASKDFDERKGYRFSTLAHLYIRREIYSFTKSQSRIKRGNGKSIVSIDLEVDEAERSTLGELIASDTNVLDEVEARFLYRKLLQKDKRKIVPLLIEGYSTSEIAKKFGVTRVTVNNWRNKLRDEIAMSE